jgi:Fic family protein
MYVEKKKIGNKRYYYLKISARSGNKTKTKTIAYLGKEPMTKQQIKEKVQAVLKSKIEAAKTALKEELKESIGDINTKFLSKKQLERLKEIKKDFIKKLKNSDKKLLEDMFKDFKTDYIYNTNAIEGNTLTLEETNLLLNENKSPEGKDLREIYDHINEKETFDYLLKEKPKINTDLIIKIHAALLKNIDKRIGSFRKHNVRVFGASFETTDAKYICTDMNILLKWHKKNKRRLHPLILASIFHEKFERIHPFYDGNGRTGRMLINLILLKNDLPPLIIKNKTRKEYYQVLTLGHKADLTKIEPDYYKEIVKFCYKQLLDTYEKIFSKWG